MKLIISIKTCGIIMLKYKKILTALTGVMLIRQEKDCMNRKKLLPLHLSPFAT